MRLAYSSHSKLLPVKIRMFLLFALIPITACTEDIPINNPPDTGDGWKVGTLAEVGLDEEPIAEALKGIENGRYPNVHSLLVIKDDLLVLEEYFPGHEWAPGAKDYQGRSVDFDRDTLHTTMSVTKAFTSAVVGIAVEQGVIAGVQDPIFDYFPEYQHLRTAENEAITVEHLLTMSSGLQWNEWEYPLNDTRNDLIRLWIVDDPPAYILGKAQAHEPGSTWYYSGGDVILLGEIIQEGSGQRFDHYATEQLLTPLGITDY